MRAQRSLFTILLFALMIVTVSGCSKRGKQSRTMIVTSFLPVQDLVLDLAGDLDDVQIERLAPTGGGCPEHYTLTPGDLALVREADIVVTHGLGLDGWLSDHKETRENQAWIELADTLRDLFPSDAAEEYNEEHGAPQPHTWVAPDLLAREAWFLGNHLAALMPQHADTIRARAQALSTHLLELNDEYQELASSQGHPDVAAFHTSFNVLAERTGLRMAFVLQLDPDVAPGPQETAAAITRLKGGKVAALLSEPQIDPRFVASIQKESGRTVYTLDPVVTGDPKRGALLQAQEDNLAELREALGATQ